MSAATPVPRCGPYSPGHAVIWTSPRGARSGCWGCTPGPTLMLTRRRLSPATPVEQARRLLDTLARAHLIQPYGPGRYGLHDLLRAYARELAAPDSEEKNGVR